MRQVAGTDRRPLNHANDVCEINLSVSYQTSLFDIIFHLYYCYSTAFSLEKGNGTTFVAVKLGENVGRL